MIWLLVILVALALIAGLLWWAPVVIRIEFYRQNGDDEGAVSMEYLFGLIHRKKRLTHLEAKADGGPVLKVRTHKTGEPNSEKTVEHRLTVEEALSALLHWQDWLAFVGRFLPLIRKLFEKVQFDKLSLHGALGTGEVITTGVLCGTCSAVVNSCIGYLTYVSKFTSAPEIDIAPDFQRSILNASVECIFRVRAGYAIKAIHRLLREWKRRPSYGTPNSGTDADSHGEYSRNG